MKVLLADDSAVLRAAVTKLLEGDGYEVVTAEDGVEAITKFYSERPDLVLLDVQMPKLNGYVVCRLLKEDPVAAPIPVLILTIRTSAEDRYWGVKSGANGYLTKDALGDELLNSVRSALASRALHELTSGADLVAPATGETDVLTRVCEMLDRKLFEATVVNEITALAARPIGVVESAQEVLESLSRLISFDAGAIALMDPPRTVMVVRHQLSEFEAAKFREVAGEHLARFSGGARLPVASPPHVLETSEPPRRDRDWESVHSVPLRSRGQLLGMLVVAGHDPGVFTDAALATTRTVTPALVSVFESATGFHDELSSEAAATFQSLA